MIPWSSSFWRPCLGENHHFSDPVWVSMSGVSNRQVYAYALFLMITSPLFSYFFTPKHKCSSHNLLYVFGYFPRSLSSCSSLINNANSISPYYLKNFNLHLKKMVYHLNIFKSVGMTISITSSTVLLRLNPDFLVTPLTGPPRRTQPSGKSPEARPRASSAAL